ncbi:plexin-B1-like isoform X2 [Ostrea edulis]|uniref:plexin-B1-like isoform X2 n=1 Tax=Ostrea edulis TaxID=37623 RepID=UPI0024AEE2B8|nr:plexin-B1-like isoform X2 [Ostrea edulis]
MMLSQGLCSVILISTLKAVYGNFYPTFSVPLSFAPLRRVTMKPESENIYVGGKNILLHLDGNLTVIGNKTIGPVKDSKLCSPDQKMCVSLEWRDNYVEVLKFLSKHKMVLMCGSVRQGLCRLLNSYSISLEEQFLNKHTQNFVGSSRGTIIVPYGTPGQQYDHYFIGRSWDGRKMEYTFPEFSFMEIRNRSADPDFRWEFQNTTKYTSVGICHSKRESVSTQFIYGFKKEGFVFSIYTQARNFSNGMVYETKLSRICTNDKYMSSFNEVILECRIHNIATAAFYKEDEATSTLYVAFGVSTDSLQPSHNATAAVCQFTQVEIDQMFKNLIIHCFNNADANSPPDWSTCGEAGRCLRGKMKPEKYCSAEAKSVRFTNHGVQRLKKPYFLPTAMIYKGYKTVFTSVFSHRIHPQTNILWIGTFDGYILKINLQRPYSDRKPYVWFDLSQNRSQRVEPDHVTDNSSHIFLLHGNKVSKFPLYSCQVHTTCGACVTSEDPLECGWCRDSCLMQGECSTTWYNNSCPPFLHKVYPLSGPPEGGTVVTIEGENFGEDQNTAANVTIGQAACHILNRTNSKIVCNTSSVTDDSEYVVTVTTNRLEVVRPSEIAVFAFSYKAS